MLIPEVRILPVFKKVKAVREHMNLYHVDGGSHRLSVDTLAKSIADMYALKIELYEVYAPGSRVAGNVERYQNGRAIILVKAELSDAMKRFVAVKELCHLMIDEDDDWSSLGVDTIKEMKVEFDLADKGGEGVSNPSRTQQSEHLAWMAAVSLMYPCEFHVTDKAAVDAKTVTIAKLGLHHDLPPHVVESALAQGHVFSMYDRACQS